MTPLEQVETSPIAGLDDLAIAPVAVHQQKNPKVIPIRQERRLTALDIAPRRVKLALAGCGVVGGGLVRLLHESAPAIAARFGVRFDLTRVLVRDIRRDRNLPLESRLFTSDLVSFLAADADVFIEAIGGDEPARTIASTALNRGKKVVTANKELVALHGDALSTLARENATGLDFGAAVGGSAPVISTLRDLVGAATPRSVRGILNGTSNYVISLLEHGVSFESALQSARERGLAEADCSRDLDGRDAAAKLAIVAWIAFGISPADLHVRRTPLIPGLERLIKFARTGHGCVRLIADCTQLSENRVAATVEPVIVPASSAFGRTRHEENRLEIDLGWTSPLSVSGPGAGGAPTAAALLSDLLRVSPPPNDRGAGARQFTSVADPREHRWLIASRLDLASLRAAAEANGVFPQQLSADGGDAAIVTPSVAWEVIHRLVGVLESLNAAPCVARYEADGAAEVIQ